MRSSLAIVGLAVASSAQAALLQCVFPARYQPWDSAIVAMWNEIKNAVPAIKNVNLASAYQKRGLEKRSGGTTSAIGAPCALSSVTALNNDGEPSYLGLDPDCLSNGMRFNTVIHLIIVFTKIRSPV